MSEETGIHLQPRNVQPHNEQSEGICLQPSPKQRIGILRRFWMWCRNHKAILFLLAVILVQQLILTRMAFMLKDTRDKLLDAFNYHVDRIADLRMENAELKEEIKKLKQGAPDK